MTAAGWIFDAVLAAALVLVAWRVTESERLIKAIALFVAFGLLMTIAWVRLGAPDVALAEAGIGAGFSGALFLAALARLEARNRAGRGDGDGGD